MKEINIKNRLKALELAILVFVTTNILVFILFLFGITSLDTTGGLIGIIIGSTIMYIIYRIFL